MPTFMNRLRNVFQLPKTIRESSGDFLLLEEHDSNVQKNNRPFIPPLYFPASMKTPRESSVGSNSYHSPTPYVLSSGCDENECVENNVDESESMEQALNSSHKAEKKSRSPSRFFSCVSPGEESGGERPEEISAWDLEKKTVRKAVFNRSIDLIRSVSSSLEEIKKRNMIEIEEMKFKFNFVNKQLKELREKVNLFSQYQLSHTNTPEYERYYIGLKLELNRTNGLIFEVNGYLQSRGGEQFYLSPLIS